MDTDWDLGVLTHQKFVTSPKLGSGSDNDTQETFEVTRHSNGVVIRALRPVDLVDVTLTFVGYKLLNVADNRATPVLPIVCLSPIAGRAWRVRAEFPPQHVAEQIRDAPTACQNTDWGPSRVRLSGPSRLAFKGSKTWKPRLLIAELTDWQQLEPLVHQRVSASIGVNLQTQLQAGYGLQQDQYATLGLGDAKKGVARQLLGPTQGQTSLELAGRLHFSPSEVGGWIVPPAPAQSSISESFSVPLWNVRLNRAGSDTVRAVWSGRMASGVIPSSSEPGTASEIEAEPDDPLSMLALSFKNHWEIVAQTSVYGLPALRRIADDSRAEAPVGEGEGAPRGSVVAPAFPVRFLEEAGPDAGIALAMPFEDVDISLTALGGVFDADWKGDPAALLLGPPHRGFDLERLSYRSFLGRDSRVVAVEKGYLFPLGIRASFVTLHERRILPDHAGRPISYLVRRRFIVCPRRPRTYPGPYQPSEGRAFPPRRVTMKTRVTPDLAAPTNIPLPVSLDPETIFWPQFVDKAGPKGEALSIQHFMFEWETEDAPSVKSHLLFVKNSMAGDAPAMEALVGYYNGLVDQEKSTDRPARPRTALLDGARHRYAEPLKEGDTSFDTINWTMGAQGRRRDDGRPFFAMDGRMEGADQPPFYPHVTAALINIQSLDQMLGPRGAVGVKYFEPYVEQGFGPPPENGAAPGHGIFLQLTDTNVSLAASEQSDRSGGLATPDVLVGGLSRTIGVVGAKTKKNKNGELEIDLSEASRNNFSPADFFKEAKLLGIVPLADVVALATNSTLADAPKLKQTLEYGAREILESVAAAARALRELLWGQAKVAKALGDAKAAIEKAFAEGAGVPPGTYYLADIHGRLDATLAPIFNGALKAGLEAIERATKPEDARQAIESVLPILEGLLDAIASIKKDPIPEQFSQLFDRLLSFFDLLRRDAVGQFGDYVRSLRDLADGQIKASFCQAIDQDAYGRILFGAAGDGSCEVIFKDPERALRSLGDGLFGAALEPLASAAAAIVGMGRDLEATIELKAEAVRAGVIEAIAAAIERIEERLAPLDPAVDDIRTLERQLRLAQDIIADLRTIVVPTESPKTPQQALDRARDLADQAIGLAGTAIRQRLRALESAVHPAPGESVEVLLEELIVVAEQALETSVIQPLARDAALMRDRLAETVRHLGGKGFVTVLERIGQAHRLAMEAAAVVNIGRAASGIEDLCRDVTTAAVAMSDGVMAAAQVIANDAEELIKAARAIKSPTGPANPRLLAAIDRLIAAAEGVVVTNAALTVQRNRILDAAGSICAAPHAYLDPIAALVRLRRDAGRQLLGLVRKAEAIQRILEDGAATTTADLAVNNDAALKEVSRRCAALYLGITGIAKLQPAAPIRPAVLRLAALPETAGRYADDLRLALTDAEALASKLHVELMGELSPSALGAVVEDRAAEFLDRLDRRLMGFVLQGVGFTRGALDAIEVASLEALRCLFRALRLVYAAVVKLLEAVIDLDNGHPLTAAVYRFALGVKVGYLPPFLDKLRSEAVTVGEVADTGDPVKALRLIEAYKAGTSAFGAAIGAMSSLSLVDFGQDLVGPLRDEMARLEGRIRSLAAQFVPTKVQTEYTWGTQLKAFPESDPIFYMAESRKDGTPDLAAAAHHLSLRSVFVFDVVDRTRSVTVEGRLQPFYINLVGSRFDMARVRFGAMTFTSTNGSAPSFDMKVEAVELGTYLKFVQALQSYLSPQGSGFYVKPFADLSGVEAGYIYDAGILQVGSLQFINVTFRVAARLPFFDKSDPKIGATFQFALAGPERPFLVSNPPYGGGGWIVLTANARRITSMAVSIVFGGVAAIQFGPLRGQGRIVSGIGIQKSDVTGPDGKPASLCQFTAIFEAVGEGSVACFSISISIRITLTQRVGGALAGKAVYRFSFKVGFVRFKYKVEAGYRIANKKESSAQGLYKAADETATITSNVRPKATDWAGYRRYFDLKLVAA